MSVFKVGQRVRIIANKWRPGIIGMTATIARPGGCEPPHWALDVDGLGTGDGFAAYSAYPHELAPLTDPKADAFIESVKKWKPEPVVPALPAKVHQ